MPEVEMVEGTEITPEEARGPAWNAAIAKKRKPRSEFARSRESCSRGVTGTWVSRRTADPRGAMKRLATASRLPRLPREHVRIIVRLRDGLDVRKVNNYAIMQALVRTAPALLPKQRKPTLYAQWVQNILVIATPSEGNAEAYSKLQHIHLESKSYAVAAYIAAPDNTSKGVVRGIDASLSAAQLHELFVNERNPTILEVKRIKTSQTVVLLFDGMRVPRRHVRDLHGPVLVIQETERRVLHVRSTRAPCRCVREPQHRRLQKTAESNPPQKATRVLQSVRCAEAHTQRAARPAKHRFQVPYVVRPQRRRPTQLQPAQTTAAWRPVAPSQQ
ncbi:hypothetical protein HPB48_010335 [Haemaphysalis longicornis]|uniref:Uncharacterized protein n=1 Tax=Haemaphysalis longicornis TaxID=44386 RepID=A0A9J6H6W3_HAELO|nr:hypothetical protein HPB48_010335 [Haemaphysalis longicornis]